MNDKDFKLSLKLLVEYGDEEMKRIKDLFTVFGSESSQETIKLLAKRKLDGEDWVQYKDLHATLQPRFSGPRLSTNIRRMYHAGILQRKRTKMPVSYSLSPFFEQISPLFFWMLGSKLIPVRYDDRLRVILDISKEDLKKIKGAFTLFGSTSAQEIIKFLAAEYLDGDAMVWRNHLKQNIADIYGFDQPRISSNIARLTKEGILVRAKQGKSAYYGLSQKFKEIAQVFPIIHPELPKIGNIDRENRRKANYNS